jgi:hypothetical protein
MECSRRTRSLSHDEDEGGPAGAFLLRLILILKRVVVAGVKGVVVVAFLALCFLCASVRKGETGMKDAVSLSLRAVVLFISCYKADK